MADFSNTQIRPLQSSVTPPQPVEDTSSIVSTQAIGQGVSNALNILGNTLRAGRQKSAEQAQNQVLTGFTEELGRIDSAVQQGMSVQEANTRKRNLVTTYIGNNPNLSDDIIGRYTKLEGKPGFGELTPQQEAQQDALKEAYGSGMIWQGMTPEEEQSAMDNYFALKRESQALEISSKRYSNAKARLDLDSAEFKREQQIYNHNLKKSISSMATPFFDQTNLRVNDILSGLEAAGNTPEAMIAAKRELQGLKAQTNSTLSQFSTLGDDSNKASVKALAAPILQTIDNAIEVADGTISREVYQNSIEVSKDKTLAMLFQESPEIQAIIATGELVPSIAAQLSTQYAPEVVDIVREKFPRSVANPANPKLTKEFTGILTDKVQAIDTTPRTPTKQKQAEQELADYNNKLLGSIGRNEAEYTSGTELKDAVDYIASDSFTKVMEKGGLDEEALAGASKVVERYYLGDVMPGVEKLMSSDPNAFLGKALVGLAASEAFREGRTESPDPSKAPVGSVSDMVEWSWSSGGLMFRPAPGDATINKIAAERLNKEYAPIINQAVKVHAHLQRSTDYEKAYEEMSPNMGLGVEEQGSDMGEPISPKERIQQGFEDVGQPTPTDRIDGAFEATEEIAPPDRIQGAFDAVEEVQPATPTERVDQAFEAVGTSDVQPEEEINPIDIPGSALQSTETGPTDVVASTGVLTPQEDQQATEIASQAVSQAPQQKMSSGDMMKAARQAAIDNNYDPDSQAGIAFTSKVYRQMIRGKNTTKSGEVVSPVTNNRTAKTFVSKGDAQYKGRPPNTGVPQADGILEVVRSAEAPGGYNQVNGRNQYMPLDQMTLDEVLEVQKSMPRSANHESSAVGAYQIIRKTLLGLKKEMNLTGNELFTPELQDKLGMQLLRRRGLDKYLAGKISIDQFQNNLSKEWAGLPNTSGISAYVGVGSNVATVGQSAIRGALQ